MNATIRKIEARDRQRWQALWEGYCSFYKVDLRGPVTEHTWKRIMEKDGPVRAVVAETKADGVIGIANYVIHEHTWSLTPACYLQDLFVDPKTRAKGVGKQLIDWLVGEVKAQKWSRLYWATAETNYRARGLYDKYTPHSGFLRYVIPNKDA
jgi:GNAT superfamily N-acetyltransferase